MPGTRDNDSDRAIIRTILSGDKESFAVIITRYQKLVAHVVFRMAMNMTEREDICQEVFIKVYQHLPTFRFDCKFSTWVARIAFNTCLNTLARKKSPLMEDYLQPDQSWEDVSGVQNGPEDSLENAERQACLNQEITRLPLIYRAILTLFHLENLSYREVSEVMGLPEGTVKSYLYRARQMLKEQLLSQYQPQEI